MSGKRRKAAVKLSLTHRALDDLRGVEAYSVEHWGRQVAARSLDDLEAGLNRLVEDPALLRSEPQLHDALRFYRVNKHLLACDVHGESIVVLAVLHANQDIPTRLVELEPTLAAEVALLHKRLRHS